MVTKVVVASPESVVADVLVLIGFEKNGDTSPLSASALAINGKDGKDGNDSWFTEVYKSGEFSGKAYEHAVLHRPLHLAASRVALLGAGKTLDARKLASFCTLPPTSGNPLSPTALAPRCTAYQRRPKFRSCILKTLQLLALGRPIKVLKWQRLSSYA